MEHAGGPFRNADQSSQNDDPPPEDYRYNYAEMRKHLKTLFPYLERVILPDDVAKLQYLRNMMTVKSLSTDRVENCKNVFYELHNKYSHQLNYCLPPNFKTCWLQETKFYDREKNVSSDVRCTSNIFNQDQNSESELPYKIPISENLNTINKEVENVKIDKSYCSKNAINGSMLAKNDLPAFSDSRLRLNKIIGHATNASIEKRLVSDASILHTELPTLIFDEVHKPKQSPVIPKDVLKGVNMMNIDINYIKDLLDSIKRSSCVEPIQPPPLPPQHLMNLGASRINLISTTEPNSSEVTHDSILLSKSSTSIPAQLNTQINKLHNTGSSNKSRQQLISAKRPSTSIDHENSKVICGSLHKKSLGPVIKSDEKNADLKPSFADISVPRDAKIRCKSLLSSKNNVSPFNALSSLISNGQNTIPTPFPPNKDNSNLKSLGTRAQEMSVYSGQNSSSHRNIQLVNPQVSSEHYGSSIKFNNRQLSQNQNKYDLNIDKKNDNGQFKNFTQMHVNPFHTELGTKYCDSLPYKSHSNDASKRDSRTLTSFKTTQYSNYKEYREAKYREQNKGFAINKNQRNQDQDKYRSSVNKKMGKNNIISSPYNSFGINKNQRNQDQDKYRSLVNKKMGKNSIISSPYNSFGINKNQRNQDQDKYRSLVNKKMGKNSIISSPYNSFGPVNETANTNFFKIPKIKNNEKNNEKLNDNSSVKDSRLKTFEDNINGTAVLKTDQKYKLHLKSDTIKEQRSVDGRKKSVLKKNNSSVKDSRLKTFEDNINGTAVLKTDQKYKLHLKSDTIKEQRSVDGRKKSVLKKNNSSVKDSRLKTFEDNINGTAVLKTDQKYKLHLKSDTIKEQRSVDGRKKSVLKKNNSSVKDSRLKKFEDNINGTDVLKTDQKYKLHLKSDTIKEQRSVDGQKKSVLKKSNEFIKDLKMTEKVNDSYTNKDLKIAITRSSKTDRDLKIKNIMNYKSTKNYSRPETTVNIPNKVIKNERTSKSKQISILIDHVDQKKSKEQKKYSEQNKFEKIIKDAGCLNNDIWGPSGRTRSSVRQNEILENLNVNNLKPKFEMNITTKNDKKLESSEFIQNKDSVSIPVLEEVSGWNEIRHDIISSPLKKQLGVENSTTTEFSCKSQEENIVSTSEINSTADCLLKVDDKVLIDFLKSPTFMKVISMFQDEAKMKKLNKLLKSSDVNTIDDKLKQKYSLNKEQLKIEERKMENKKRKRKNTKEKVSVESSKKSNEESKNELLNCISNDTNFNQTENIVKTKKNKSHLNESNKGNTSFGNIYGHSSTGQHKLKSKKSYGHFEILKDKSIFEEKQLKIVIARLDQSIEGRGNCNADTSTNDNTQTNKKPLNIKISQEIKSKKPFVGPLSVKLARQKMEMEVSDSPNEQNNKNQLEFETKKVIKTSKTVNSFDKKEKLNSEILAGLMKEQPIVLIRPFQIPKSHENKTDSSQSVEQSSNTSTYIVNKPGLKKARLTELDRLHADISGMFDCKAVLNASKIRQCRINKKIDYVNKNVVLSKEKDPSIIKESNSNENQNKLIYKVGKPKNTQKKVQKSTIMLNKKEQTVKKSIANKTGKVGGKPVVKRTVLNKISKTKFKKKGSKIIKKSNEQLKVSFCDGIELNNVLENEISTTIIPKIVFKDKLYFQTSENSLQCKFCNYTDKGLNIVRHYKYHHCEEEILPSRLPENCTKSLIHQSLKENFQENFQISKPICDRSVNVNYTCVFCQFIFHDYFKFYDHITGHTGEYRYKCKMCEKIYLNEDDLETHILEHTDYDKTDGISRLVFPNPISGKYVFGYLCSFCYYIQLDYNNIVKHMASQHFDEDKKLNGHWTVLRISMSMAGKIYTTFSIDFDNLVGCLPPIQSDQVISKSKDNVDQNLQLTVTNLNVPSNEQKQPDSIFFIEKKCNQQTIDKISQKSIIDDSTSESSFIQMNPPVSVYDKILPELNTLKFLPEQANQSLAKETRISTEQPEIQYSKYTLKEKSKKCVLAGVSCELINSMLLFKCSVSNCLEKFSTVVLIDFSEHIIKNHQFVIWDGNCESCHHKLPIISEQYYVSNALEHLVSHHLVLKNTEQHPNIKANFEGSKIEGLTFYQDTVKNTPISTNLKVCVLPGDNLSAHKSGGSSIANIYDMSVRKSLSDDTNSINKNVNLKVNHGSNDKKLPLSSSQISDVKSSKKRKVNTSLINSKAPDEGDLNIWMKSKTNSEVVVSSSEIFLEAGHQIVNNGEPIDGKICVIDTAYTKDYMRKVQDFPMNVIKTRSAFYEMSALPSLLRLFKCMDRNCTKSFSSKELFKLHMKIHFSNAEKKKKIQIYNVQHFKMCAYCFKEFDDEESLANHITEKYTFCKYFCPYCFYCAYTASHVLVHQSLVHTNIPKHRIIKSRYNDDACKYQKEILLVVDFKEFLLPYKCNVGCCGFSCYLHNEFVEHLNEEHQQCDKFYCYICADKENGDGFFVHHPSSMITHFKLHNLNKYQCIFCLFGSENIDSMITHLAFEHFEYELLCLERSTVSDYCDSKNIKNLKILRLKKVNSPSETFSESEILPRQSQKRFIECPDVPSMARKSARFDEGSQPPDAIALTVPDGVQMAESSTSESALNNDFIMIDDDDDYDVNQNDTHESLAIISVWSDYNNIEKKSEVLSNDDIIVTNEDDDVDLSEKEKLNKGPTKQICSKIEKSINESNNIKRLAYPIIALDKLFACKKCEIVFSNGEMYCAHLKVCPFWDFSGQRCMYCVKIYSTPTNMAEHIKLHGPDRFNCYLCNLKVPSQRAITLHMKNKHKIININFVPDNPNFNNLSKDDFTVFEDNTVNIKKIQQISCDKCPFKGTARRIINHKMLYHKAEQNVNCKYNLHKMKQEQPNDSNNSVNSLMPQQNEQQNTRLKRKSSTVMKSHAVPKSPKSATISSSIQPYKHTTFKYNFNKNGKLGTISSNGHFVCPKCNVFETCHIKEFRKHLLKEVNYKINLWKCLVCSEISDSPIKIARHVKKHGIGSEYEKIKDAEKLKWVDRVVVHQHNMLLTELNKNRTTKDVKSVESSKTIIVNNERKSYFPTKKNSIALEKKVLVSQPIPDSVSNDDIIDLVDDSDNE